MILKNIQIEINSVGHITFQVQTIPQINFNLSDVWAEKFFRPYVCQVEDCISCVPST